MQIMAFESAPRISPFAPEWRWIFCETEVTDIDWSEVSSFILKKETEILSKTEPVDKVMSVDGYTGLGANSLTSRYNRFNVFAWDDDNIQKIFNQVKEKHLQFLDILNVPRRKLWIQCWANVLRNSQEIKPHLHTVNPYCYLGGHITVQCNNSKTVYINPINQINDPEIYESVNVPGKLTFFQNNIPHYTTPNVGDKERISIAFDIVLEGAIEDKTNLVLFDDPN